MMKTLQTIFILLLTSGSVASAATPAVVEVGSHLPDAVLHNLDGSTQSISRYRGKPLIINVWASWCGPCRSEMPSLERLANRYKHDELNVIGVSTDDYHDKAATLIKQTEVTFENYLDRNLQLEKLLGADRIPLTILVDANGRILKKVRGAREWDNPDTIDAIEKILLGKQRPDPMFGLRILSQQ